MDVEIISKEFIKPSSPTPLHLKTYKLSLLDQLHDHCYPPVSLYYPLKQDTELSISSTDIDQIVSKRLQLLKQSLSETLSSFYPLAGKMKDKLSVDCNDEGIYFAEARAKCTLNEFLNRPDLSLVIFKFHPVVGNEQRQSKEIAGAHVGKIQVTRFSCGGLVICACILHMVADGVTLGSFLMSWAARAGKNIGEDTSICPNYEISSLFPQNDHTYPREATAFSKSGKFVVRRFVFDAQAIANLKAKATTSSTSLQNPSRVEVVTALISKRIMAAFKAKSGSYKPNLLTRVLNLRPLVRPPLSENSFGNFVWNADALCKDHDDEVELDGLVWKLRESFTKVVKRLQGDGEGSLISLCEGIKDENKEVFADAKDRISFSSVCNFPFYDIDFGWGKPIWMNFTSFDGSIVQFANFVILSDTRSGDGIEAWLHLLEEDLALLELDRELLGFASLDPTPLGKCSSISHNVIPQSKL
ncbi:HXXXD-type acyl-transferase family protein [Citrus sinensis]|uniref:Uncharacterized protein n=1 Tax=Citrus clementina TaxID=85681 RepID=V4ULX3_CITCL|nr:vinorine synthase [Citrus x clementina]ESR40409.1 hypothetical protein CICLE_v10027043mg [Citrus x clementina]KAH9666467.1 HXXXD-type acyl-transferase family protein [Citrus sinensis]